MCMAPSAMVREFNLPRDSRQVVWGYSLLLNVVDDDDDG